MAQVASALDAAHAAGLVHRDVKLANILVDTVPGLSEHAYLSDFGLSKEMSSTGLTAPGQFLGTPDYSAPEQIRSAHVDGRADQYALACVAFTLLTGTPPFRRQEAVATLFAHLQDPVPLVTGPRPDLPAAVDGVIARALAKSPADRYSRCGEFAAALLDSTAPARPATSPARPTFARPGAATSETAACAAALDTSPGRFTQQGHGTDSLPLPAGRAARGNTFRTKALMATSGVVALLTAVIAIVANMAGGSPHSPGAPRQTATGAAANR